MLRLFRSACKDLSVGNLDTLALGGSECDLSKARCPSCRSPFLIGHSSYRRNFTYIKDGIVIDATIDIRRLRCCSCGRTHALLPSAVIPHSPFSVRLVASIIIDYLEHSFSSIEELCVRYGIAVNTFYRIRRRFEHCVRLACGLMPHVVGARQAAGVLAGPCTVAADGLLSGFFRLTGTSFCQGRGP